MLIRNPELTLSDPRFKSGSIEYLLDGFIRHVDFLGYVLHPFDRISLLMGEPHFALSIRMSGPHNGL